MLDLKALGGSERFRAPNPPLCENDNVAALALLVSVRMGLTDLRCAMPVPPLRGGCRLLDDVESASLDFFTDERIGEAAAWGVNGAWEDRREEAGVNAFDRVVLLNSDIRMLVVVRFNDSSA
jgi:hypothetical protein